MKLDLRPIKNQTLDITLVDGTTLNIKKPDKKLLLEIVKCDTSKLNQKDFMEILSISEEIVCKILSNNTDGIEYTKEKLEELEIGYDVQTVILNSYIEFTSTISA